MLFQRNRPCVACWDSAIAYVKPNGTVWALGYNTSNRFGVKSSEVSRFNEWTQLSIDNVETVWPYGSGMLIRRRNGETWKSGISYSSYLNGEKMSNVPSGFTNDEEYRATWTQFPISNITNVHMCEYNSSCYVITTDCGESYTNCYSYLYNVTSYSSFYQQFVKLPFKNIVKLFYVGYYDSSLKTSLWRYFFLNNKGEVIYDKNANAFFSADSYKTVEDPINYAIANRTFIDLDFYQTYNSTANYYWYQGINDSKNFINYRSSWYENTSNTPNYYSEFGRGTGTLPPYYNTTFSETVLVRDCKQFLRCNKAVYVLKNDGTVWAWGNNQYGQLGLEYDKSDYASWKSSYGTDGRGYGVTSPKQINVQNIDYIAGAYNGSYALLLTTAGEMMII